MVYDDPPAETPETPQKTPTVPSLETKTRLEVLKERLKAIMEQNRENRKQFRNDRKVSRMEGEIGGTIRDEARREGRRGRYLFEETANENEQNVRVAGQQENKWLRTEGRNGVDMAGIQGRTGRRLDRKVARINRKLRRIDIQNARVATRFDEYGFRLSRKERKERLRQALADLTSAPAPTTQSYPQLAYPTFPDANPNFEQFNKIPDAKKMAPSASLAFPWQTTPKKDVPQSPTKTASQSPELVDTHLERSSAVSKALETANMGELDYAARLILDRESVYKELRQSPESKKIVIQEMQNKLSLNDVGSLDVRHLYEELQKSPDKRNDHALKMKSISGKVLELKPQLTPEHLQTLALILDPTAKERGILRDERMIETKVLEWLINDPLQDPQFYTYEQANEAEKYLTGLKFDQKLAQKKAVKPAVKKSEEVSDKPKEGGRKSADELVEAFDI